MYCCNQKCGSGISCCIAIIVSIVLGTIVGVLFNFGLIPFINIAVWIAFGISVLSLILLIFGVYLGAITAPNALSKCLCKNIACLTTGIMGTILVAIAALAIVLNPIFPLVVALIALGAAFFSILLISLIAFIACFVCKLCAYHSDLE